jgi:hypothetical protein
VSAASAASGVAQSGATGVGAARLVWGVELIANGVFSADSDWTKGANWTIANGVATKSAGLTSVLDQAEAFTAGGKYRVAFGVTARVAGSVTPQFTGGSTVGGTARTAVASYVEHLTAVTGNNNFRFTSAAAGDLSIDNVSVRRIR